MTEPLLLVAASGLAREAIEAVRAGGVQRVVGILDDNPARWRTELAGVPVLGPAEVAAEFPDARLLLCPGRGGSRAALVQRLLAQGVGEERFATVVHPAAVVPPGAVLGAGTILLAGTIITDTISIGRHVVVMPNVVLTHGVFVSDYATVCAGAVLNGDVRVGEGAYLGAGCLVRERCQVGEDATVGMGAVVIRDVPPGGVWVGNPARPLEADGGPIRPAARPARLGA